MRRRGELSKGMIDRDWPHQVALPSPVVVARFKEIQACAGQLGRTFYFANAQVPNPTHLLLSEMVSYWTRG